ncbi:MAG: hypothetical protein HOY69_40375 [Streptomyces sp.]|nr:hypothetical protein [Streptomyces sp.]
MTDVESVTVVEERTGAGVGFRLNSSTGLGRFHFCPSPWTVGKITRARTSDGAAGVGGRDTGPQLIIKRVEIRTHTGVHAVHLVPLLVMPAV